MADHLGALVEGRFEEFTGEFILARLAFVGGSQFPHGSGKDNVLQRRVTAKFTEHPEIPSSGSAESIVGNAVDIDDPRELSAMLISVEFSLGGREQRVPVYAYLVDKKLAILANISASLIDSELSSNPGVSIRVTILPPRGNSFESSTSLVAESKVVPTRRSEPLARLMNWRRQGVGLKCVLPDSHGLPVFCHFQLVP